MTSKELVATIRMRFEVSPIPPREVLLIARILCHELAENVYHLQLADGQRLNDQIDFCALLREVEAVIGQQESRSLPNACPRCGHVHLGEKECGEDMGGAGTCQCTVEVHA